MRGGDADEGSRRAWQPVLPPSRWPDAFAPHPGMPGTAWPSASRRSAPAGRGRGDRAISRDTLPLLAEIRDHVDDQARVNRAIVRIDALRARMNDLGACYDLIAQLTQPTELKRFEADRRISAAKLDAREKQRRQVGRDIENVRGIAGGRASSSADAAGDRAVERQPPDGRPRERHASRAHVTAVLSMLHEPASATAPRACSAAARCCGGRSSGSAGRRASRRRDRLLGGPARRRRAVAEARARGRAGQGPARRVPELESVAAARRWADGWRGGLLGTCEFDRGFHAGWSEEVAAKLAATPSCSSTPRRADRPRPRRRPHRPRAGAPAGRAVLHARRPGADRRAAPPAAAPRLAAARRTPAGCCTTRPTRSAASRSAATRAPRCRRVARTTSRFTLDSDRQLDRIARATFALNGQLIASPAKTSSPGCTPPSRVDAMPREVVLELNTARATRPIYWPGRYHAVSGPTSRWSGPTDLRRARAAADDVR
jgi:hypothetical protein